MFWRLGVLLKAARERLAPAAPPTKTSKESN
jgi:hypothetical protein